MGIRSTWVFSICDVSCVPGRELWVVRLALPELFLSSGDS